MSNETHTATINSPSLGGNQYHIEYKIVNGGTAEIIRVFDFADEIMQEVYDKTINPMFHDLLKTICEQDYAQKLSNEIKLKKGNVPKEPGDYLVKTNDKSDTIMIIVNEFQISYSHFLLSPNWFYSDKLKTTTE